MKIEKNMNNNAIVKKKILKLGNHAKTNLIGMNGLELAILHDQLHLQVLLQDFH